MNLVVIPGGGGVIAMVGWVVNHNEMAAATFAFAEFCDGSGELIELMFDERGPPGAIDAIVGVVVNMA